MSVTSSLFLIDSERGESSHLNYMYAQILLLHSMYKCKAATAHVQVCDHHVNTMFVTSGHLFFFNKAMRDVIPKSSIFAD